MTAHAWRTVKQIFLTDSADHRWSIPVLPAWTRPSASSGSPSPSGERGSDAERDLGDHRKSHRPRLV